MTSNIVGLPDYLIGAPVLVDSTRWTDNTVRCAVMSLLKEMSQSSLAKLCPLTQSAISNIANWKYSNKLSSDKCKEFGDWYTKFTKQSKEFPPDGTPKDSRQTFHPQHEIGLMRKWYQTCKHPSNEKLRFFAEELNRGHVRQERPKVTVSKLKNWWKNERQREKRYEQKKDPEDKCEEETTGNIHNRSQSNQTNPSASNTQNVLHSENITVEDVNAQEQNNENDRLKFSAPSVPPYRFTATEHRIPVINQPFTFTNHGNPFIFGNIIGHNVREEHFGNPDG